MSNSPLINIIKKEKEVKTKKEDNYPKTNESNNDLIIGCGINKYRVKKNEQGKTILEKIKIF